MTVEFDETSPDERTRSGSKLLWWIISEKSIMARDNIDIGFEVGDIFELKEKLVYVINK